MLRNLLMGAAAAVSLAVAGAAWAGPADDPANWRKVRSGEPAAADDQRTGRAGRAAPRRGADACGADQEDRAGGAFRQGAVPSRDRRLHGAGRRHIAGLSAGAAIRAQGEFTWQRDPAKQKVTWIGSTPMASSSAISMACWCRASRMRLAMISYPPWRGRGCCTAPASRRWRAQTIRTARRRSSS